jgi:hypothetical protein
MTSLNADRAAWAESALNAFRRKTGADHDDCLVDLLCNLMHWADRKDVDFREALDIAESHYRAEIAEEGGAQ